MPQLTPEVFDSFRKLLYERSGITLKNGKESLLTNRLQKRMRQLGVHHYEDYLGMLTSGQHPDELVNFLDNLSTNLTSFFRESHHFDHLDQFLRAKSLQGKGEVRIWSAACSTGEEPYSIAMVAQRFFGNEAQRIKILATDINTTVLQKADHGVYQTRDLEKMDPELKLRHFNRTDGQHYAVKKSLRQYILFKRINLAAPRLPLKGKQFDAIFCRNVMIYFDKKVRQQLLNEIYRLLKDNGVLYLGHADTVNDLEHQFTLKGHTIYEKKGG
jgi:chemotaxis protein methyltransferase CheR